MIWLHLIRILQVSLLLGGTVSAALAGMSAERYDVDLFGVRLSRVLACWLAIAVLECALHAASPLAG